MLAKHKISYKGEVFPGAADVISAIRRRKQLGIFPYIADFQDNVGLFSLA